MRTLKTCDILHHTNGDYIDILQQENKVLTRISFYKRYKRCSSGSDDRVWRGEVPVDHVGYHLGPAALLPVRHHRAKTTIFRILIFYLKTTFSGQICFVTLRHSSADIQDRNISSRQSSVKYLLCRDRGSLFQVAALDRLI